MKYILYARKSSESEDKQVQSIDDQLAALRKLAAQRGITIVSEMTESKSAKAPYQRPRFEELLSEIEKGHAQGILCWHVNRLFRNPVDYGRIQWMLTSSSLAAITTPEREYLPDDNQLLLSVENGVASQYIADLRKAVLRGTQSKIEKGWFPHRVPEGYTNNRIEKTVEVDPERFALLRKAWDLMLAGHRSVPEVLEILNDDWGYRSRPLKRMGGGKLSRSALFYMFGNIFYAGFFNHDGTVYKRRHKAMVTLDEFAYSGLLTCGQCGRMISGLKKTKYIKSEGKIKSYTYYYCARSDGQCNRANTITEQELEKKIAGTLTEITILPEFKEMALEGIARWKLETEQSRDAVEEQQHKTIKDVSQQIDTLLSLRLKELISDEEFKARKKLLENDLNHLKQNTERTEGTRDASWDAVEQAIHFALNAHELFAKGDLRTKGGVAKALGAKYLLTGGELTIQLNELLIPIQKDYPELEHRYAILELKVNGSDYTKEDALASLRLSWWVHWDSNPEPMA